MLSCISTQAFCIASRISHCFSLIVVDAGAIAQYLDDLSKFRLMYSPLYSDSYSELPRSIRLYIHHNRIAQYTSAWLQNPTATLTTRADSFDDFQTSDNIRSEFLL